MPVANELKKRLTNFPLTIMCVESLECLGYFYQYLAHELKEIQLCGEPIPQNRIFAQYHKDYPNTMKQLIVSELVKERSNLRLALVTVALGMGLNAPCMQRIIHCKPPTTMEKYMQEIGRAGRNGQEAEAIMFYNMSDVSKSRKGFITAMREFCLLENKYYRTELLNYFGFNYMMYNGDKRKCCSYYKNTCS
jgi:ATP-dependent DNA helicase RecQ